MHCVCVWERERERVREGQVKKIMIFGERETNIWIE